MENLALNRRTFLKLSSAGAAVAVVTVPSSVLLEGCSTSWITTVEKDLPVIVNIVQSIIAIIAEATGNGTLAASAAALMANASNVLNAALNALSQAVTAYNAAKTQGNLDAVIAALQSAQSAASGVITALQTAGVPVSSSIATVVTAGIGTAIVILSSIQVLIPGAAPASVVMKAQVKAGLGKVAVPGTDTLKYGYNSVLWLHGLSTHAV